MSLELVDPVSLGFRRGALDALDTLLSDSVLRGAFPGAVAVVGRQGALARVAVAGRLTYDDTSAKVTPKTIYDLASLTKVVATTTIALSLVEDRLLDLEARVGSILPGFSGGGREATTVEQLLCHTGGLVWHAPLHLDARGPQEVIERAMALPLAYAPGTSCVYSDIGFILLGAVIERVADARMDTLLEERVTGPLGMRETGYLPDPGIRARIAPTEYDPWRRRLLCGEVHDENAAALGGVAPHAGLFGTALDLARFAELWRAGGVFGGLQLASGNLVERFVRRAPVAASTRALGWDLPTGKSAAGDLFSPRSFGHLGFTGTSLWIDPDRSLFLILLTNRVHPTRENNQIREVRRAAADLVIRSLDPAEANR